MAGNESFSVRPYSLEDEQRENELYLMNQRTPVETFTLDGEPRQSHMTAAAPVFAISSVPSSGDRAPITTALDLADSRTGNHEHGMRVNDPDNTSGFFYSGAGVGFVDGSPDDHEPSRGNRRVTITMGVLAATAVAGIWGAGSVLSPDKPATTHAETTINPTPPKEAPGVEFAQPDTGTPSPTDLPKALAVAPTTPKASEKAPTTTTSKPSATQTAPRHSTPAEAPGAPIVPSTSPETPSPSSSPTPTETDSPSQAEAPRPSDRTIAALKREVNKSARAEAGEYASKDTLQQILAETGLSRQDILDWQQRYQQTTSDTSTTLENSLGGQSYSPVTSLVHYTDRLQQQAVDTHDGSLFKLAWIDPRTAEARSNQLQNGEVQSYPEADNAEAAGVEKAEVDGQKETFAVVVAEYPTSLGFTERHLSWYIVLAGAEGESRFVLVAEKADQSPYQPPTVEHTPDPTTDPTPTEEPTTDTPVDTSTPTENSGYDYYGSANARRDQSTRRGNVNRPSWTSGDRSANH
jgi:hypothetical protein